jgi:beta-glucanase (GH16 family)
VPRTRRNIVLLVSGVAVAAVLAGSLPLLAGDQPELTLTAATDTTSTPVRTDGDNSAKSTLATCPALCERNPAGWRDAVVSFDVKGVPAGATGVTAQLWLYSWKQFGAATTAHVGGSTLGYGLSTARPPLGTALSSSGSVRKGYNTWDVTPAVQGNGVYTFTVRQDGLGSRVYWASRENKKSSIRPRLVLTWKAGTGKPPGSPATTSSAAAPSSSRTVSARPSSPSSGPVASPPPVVTVKPTTAPPVAAPPAAPAGWRLSWADEFDGDRLDAKKWQAKDDTKVDYDLACITADNDNVFVSDGMVTLRARKEKETCGSTTRDYSTSYLTTQGRASFTYGRFEMRAKTPTGPADSTGLWPAFWLRPDDGGVGEIDVVELPGGAKYHQAATQAIFLDYTPVKQDNRHPFPTGYPADGFHTYTTEWEPGVLRWYIDGKLVWQRDRTTTPWFDKAFSRPFHLRLNFQVGGWLGNPDAATRFPADYQVDYVRVWKRG